jgi:purine-binding chemotaxis protein CheW
MTALAPVSADRVSELRADFDAAFAQPARPERNEWVDLLAIRVGDVPYAVRVADLAGIYVDKAITAVPGSPAAVRGLAGFRGAVVVVYDLAVLLGGAGGAAGRWIAAAAADNQVAFAFTQFDGHVRVDSDAFALGADDADGSRARETVHVSGVVRPIIRVSTLLDTITRAPNARKQEH